jgi:hypothetical protein
MRATRDIADDFAAHALHARLAVRHHAHGGRNDRHTQPVHHLRQGVAAPVDAKSRAGNPLEPLDHRPARVVLQADAQLRVPGAGGVDPEPFDVTLVLQHPRDRDLQLRRRHRDVGLFDALGVANPGQHVGNRITHAHRDNSAPTSWP